MSSSRPKKGATAVTNYEFWSLESSMVYHLIYHHSLAIHINHLVFLNTYLFGVFLVASSTGLWPVVATLVALYVLYAVALMHGGGMSIVVSIPYTVFVTCLASAAWFVVDDTSWDYALIGLGVVLVSLLAQLAGHALHEDFAPPPLLKHGFVSAPVLEYVSLMFRLGRCPKIKEAVSTKVKKARAEA